MPARDYQRMAAQSIWNYFATKDGNPLILMPTGTGKSHVIAEFTESVLRNYPRQRIQVLTHVKELIKQNYTKFLQAWPNAPAGIYSAGLNQRDVHNNVVFGGIMSVAKKAHIFGHVDLVIVDEADLVNPTEMTAYTKYFEALRKVNPYLKIIGLTATGFRLGYGKITDGGIFTDTCFDMTGVEAFNWLIEQGYLIPLIPKPTKGQLDVSGVHMRGGEYIQGELQNAVDKHEITHKALCEAIFHGTTRKKWLIFASGVEHAIHISEELNELGVTCGVVHSNLTTAERDKVLADHRSGAIRAIVNNNILTTGYDDPGIDFILCLRPTASSRLWVQMMGRGTRPEYALGYDLETQLGRLASIAASEKQNCLVLDFAGNIRKLGPINDPVIPRKKGEGVGTAPIKLCDCCDTYNHASARVCFVCNEAFNFAVKIKQEAATVELIKGNLPIVEDFEVTQITYQRWQSAGKPPMMKVSYYCGLRMFNEFVCLEHLTFAGKKARDWWKKRSLLPPPESTDQALYFAEQLKAPTHIRVWINKPYPDIMDVDFAGTNFGKQPPSAPPPVSVSTTRSWASLAPGALVPRAPVDPDADIPFDMAHNHTGVIFSQDEEIPF